MNSIDWKYKIDAVNPCSGNRHTDEDAVLFLAKDKALPAALRAYLVECEKLGAEPGHLESVQGLLLRVEAYQENVEAKVPDTDGPGELDRCLNGPVE